MSTICIAANTTWYIYNFRARLISTLLSNGHQVVAFSPADKYVPRIEALGAWHHHLEMDNTGTNPALELLTLARIGHALRCLRPGLILTYTPKINIYVALAVTGLRIPVIANVSGLGHSAGGRAWIGLITRMLYRIALRKPSTVFFQNEDDRQEFIKSGLVHAAKTERLPGSGVDINRFKPRMASRQHKEFVFLLSARMLWAKGIGEFVRAARNVRAQVPTTRFCLLGFLDPDNPNSVPSDEIRRWCNEGLVDFLGETDDVRDVYARSDCMVLPSYYREGVPRSILEAASMGLPVITTDTPGCRDAVEDGTSGYLCRPKDVDDLTACMFRILALKPHERVAMGVAARQKMLREFDERTVIERYMTSVNTLMCKRTKET